MSTLPPPVEIETITLLAARQQHPECFPPPSRRSAHHQASNSREHKVAVLIKASLDAAVELDWLKNVAGVKLEQRDTCKQIISRIYAACEEMGIVIDVEDVAGHYCDEGN